ncbi:GntR family transcriptional regulator [Burkholderiaceae bacterium FT117]|uniref:GntR family transcriptional regulator n=1 Tax=Zeimonas sediminis TaxID=2944268 RepID=UPI002342C6E7|nr:GntR family transcriptional regulator [Zeimonas sediminis]MCM5570450.1 GntR family transcriptional regulator [Zeimonas sediminis]
MTTHSHTGLAEAYRKIKEGILELRYRPGQKLSETKLAAELRLGRSPIRGALARLERDGWVRVLPQSGTFVRKLSLEEIAAMSELRLLLESHAASVAALRVSPDELALLRAKFESLKASGVDGHFDEFLDLDDLFHGLVYRVAGNPLITQILQNLRDQIHWVRVTTAVLPGRVDASLHEMDRVLDAMERRDPDAAAEAMRQHIGNIAVSYEAVPADDEGVADAA